jgi:hypothetical protein
VQSQCCGERAVGGFDPISRGAALAASAKARWQKRQCSPQTKIPLKRESSGSLRRAVARA